MQVVSLDWKWLLIYPEQGVAAVNTLTIPAATPISLELTSSGVMNSFFVPQLAGQIYTMGAMRTRLQLMADQPGTYEGRSANFSGRGFSDMFFFVHAVPPDEFDAWVAKTKTSGPALDRQNYDELAKPSEKVKPFTYASVTPGMFDHDWRHAAGRIFAPEIPSERQKDRAVNILGKLNWSAIPFDEPEAMATSVVMIVGIGAVLIWITVRGLLAVSVARMAYQR